MKRIINGEKANIIGGNIREARLKAGLSQQELSAKLELMAVYVCRGSVSRIENGERAVTDIEIDAISKVLKVSLDYLFGRETKKQLTTAQCGQSVVFCFVYAVHIINKFLALEIESKGDNIGRSRCHDCHRAVFCNVFSCSCASAGEKRK